MSAFNSWKFTTGLVLVALVCVAVAAWALGSSGGSGSRGRETGITVADSVEVKGAPDTACVTFGVVSSNPNAARTAQQNAEATKSVIEALLDIGLAKSDIETNNYFFYPQTDHDSVPAKVIRYRASNQVKARTRTMTKVAHVIEAGMESGATSLEGVEFDIRDKEYFRKKALAGAVKKSRDKARTMAEAMGVELGRTKLSPHRWFPRT